MQQFEEFLRKNTIALQICFIVIAACFLSININRPLTDYDEATYAKVVVDTLKSGDVLSFTLSGNSWYEKPPMYLWLAMGSVKLFGEHEFAFRIPSILASLLCLWLTYLIARRLTNSELAGLAAFLVLLFTSAFLFYAREARLDSSVLASILAAFWCWIKARENEKYLFWILPLVATGFLFKSVIVLLLGPILFIYSLFYQKWAWIKSKYLWLGLPLSLIIFIPWHAIQIARFGNDFLNRYFGYDVYKRATTTVIGNSKYYDYINWLWVSEKGWLIVLLGMIVLFVCLIIFGKKFKPSFVWRPIAAPLFTFLSIIILFSAAKTHLSPYVMPAYPFIAMFIALLAYYTTEKYDGDLSNYFFIISPLIIIGFIYCISMINGTVLPYVPDEVDIGKIYNKSNTTSAPLYAIEWPALETMNYYGSTKVKSLSATGVSGKELKGPFYLAIPVNGLNYFFTTQNGLLSSSYTNIHLIGAGKFLALLYFDSDMRFPMFSLPK